MSAFNGVLERCVQIVGIDPVDVGSVALDQELDNVVVTIDGSDLHPGPPVLGHIINVLGLRKKNKIMSWQ